MASHDVLPQPQHLVLSINAPAAMTNYHELNGLKQPKNIML